LPPEFEEGVAGVSRGLRAQKGKRKGGREVRRRWRVEKVAWRDGGSRRPPVVEKTTGGPGTGQGA
jgi:hypothetical protein